MAEGLKLTCLECGAVNRVPEAKLGAGPKCGTCGARLNDGKVRLTGLSVLPGLTRGV
jgi:thioredoxin 2